MINSDGRYRDFLFVRPTNRANAALHPRYLPDLSLNEIKSGMALIMDTNIAALSGMAEFIPEKQLLASVLLSFVSIFRNNSRNSWFCSKAP